MPVSRQDNVHPHLRAGTKWIKMPLKYLAVIDLPAIAHPTESISYTETTHFTTGIETLTPLD